MALDFPPIFLLPTHLDPEQMHRLEEQITSLTYDINEAEIVVGNISRRERALFELRHRKILTEPLDEVGTKPQTGSPARKRQKLSVTGRDEHGDAGSFTGTEDDGVEHEPYLKDRSEQRETRHTDSPNLSIRVVKLTWLTDSLNQGAVLPTTDYLLYEGRKVISHVRNISTGSDILSRALAESSQSQSLAASGVKESPTRNKRNRFEKSGSAIHPPSLYRQTTSEHDSDVRLPPVPAFLRTTYSCQRSTPVNPPNGRFVEELKKIRTTRRLIGDQIGVRAYSTSIATLSAYPYPLTSAPEVARLPGCGTKIAELYQEWKDTERLREAEDAESDPKLSVIRLYYDIWGVGDTTARAFYNKGWRDLDDVVEYGWDSLTRVQQIGAKYYDEFKLKIPRTEVESIANTILSHARQFSPDYQLVIVGGYRRGKQGSGDVDVIISHPDEEATHNFVEKLVTSLEKSKFITHTLTLSTHNSERGQMPLSWKGNERKGSGFDTLDKALVVWQDPGSDGEETRSPAEEGSTTKSTDRPHRRVDIILSPWKTAGCAVLGWSGDTTFQRDLRRYCKKEKNLKFDSSGIRSRLDGSWVDFEGRTIGKAPDMVAAEKRVFQGLGLEWRSAEERCTG